MRSSVGTPKARGPGRQSGPFRVPQTSQQQRQQQQQQIEQEAKDDALDDAEIFNDEEGGTHIGDIYIPPPVPPHCSMESYGARLIIKKIVNRNFKSYADEVELGPFHHCFTAIIGPNGSGKSNVIDSMQFVFGSRAQRLRCKKVSTLIHKSAKYPDLRSCSVAVHFEQVLDKQDGTVETVADSQIVIERTAMADNSSYYQINGRRVMLKEVAQLLKKHHVDLSNNRFLILQGEIESIAMMKPKAANEHEVGMLEYLEDILGTHRYVRPLQQINERVDILTNDRTEKHNRCKMAEREMKDLEQPYNEAVEYLKAENSMVRAKNWLKQKYISMKKQKLEELTKEHETCAEALKTHDEGTEDLKKHRQEKEELIRKEVEAYEALCKSRDNAKKQLVKAERNCTEVQSNMENINKQRKKDKVQIEKNDVELETLHKLPAKNEKEIAECKTKLERLEKEKTQLNEELEQQLAELTEKAKPIVEKRLKCSDELVGLKEESNAAKAELQVHESELKILKQQETTETRKYTSLKSSYEEASQSLQEKRKKVEELKERIPQLKTDIATKNAEMEKLVKEEQKLSAHHTKLREEINERSSTMQMQRSNNKVLDFLMRQKAEGKIPGILGRLGDLGGIDAKYDIAISTACGRLDNIVVDHLDTAQMAIEALKQHNVGRASFIALNKLEHRAYPINTPENVPRLYDLVQIEDERVRPAFFFALGNTLVANDLEQGSRIAYGRERFRVVTLRGDIIEQTGTMSGGGNRPIRGKMGTQVQTKTSESTESSQISQKALEDMQVQAEELRARINFNMEQQGHLEHEVQQLQVTLQRSEAELKHLGVSITSLDQQLASSLKQCEVQKKRMDAIKIDEHAVNAREAEIEKAKERLEKAQKAEMTTSSQLEKIQAEQDALRNESVKPVEAKISKVTSQIKKLSANVSSLTVALTTAERSIERINNSNQNLRENIKTAEDKLRGLNEERQQCAERKEQLEKDAEEAEEAIKNAKSQSSEIKKEIDNLNKQENERNIQRIEIETKLQATTSKVNEIKSAIPQLEQDLKSLKLNEIPGETEPVAPLKTLTEEELNSETWEEVQFKQTMLDEQLRKKPNLSCIKDFCDKRDVYLERVQVLEDITSKRNEMRDKYEEVRKRRYTEFMEGFNIITRRLKEMYQMITLGGDAELELVDSMDPFNEGVSFSVRPPKKTWKNISNLSGGEKTLSSLALVFALHYYKPSPLYFMDEIDAALDFKNVSIVAHYIKERTKNAQFIIVSLRVNMFELSNYLVGIYKFKDCTQSVTLHNYPPEDLPQSQPVIRCATPTVVENEENEAPATQENVVSDGRITTFVPPHESTALTQSLQVESARSTIATVMEATVNSIIVNESQARQLQQE